MMSNDSDIFHNPDPSELWVPAKYRKNGELERIYMHNPLIAALPPLMSQKEATDNLAFRLNYCESDREGPPEVRCIRASGLYILREPLSFYYEIYISLYSLLNNGYIERNPIPELSLKQLKSGGKNIKGANQKNANHKWPELSLIMSILGCSGVGKTCSTKQVLQTFSQAIRHCSYQGYPFEQVQIPCLRLECPSKGSLNTLEMEFFLELDSILGTEYYKRILSKRYSSERMLLEVALLIKQFKIGILVIDEIHRLFLMLKDEEFYDINNCQDRTKANIKSDSKKLLESLIRMSNTLPVSLVFIGTGTMDLIFPSSLPLARRFSQAGSISIDRLSPSSIDWSTVINSLWEYQYTTDKVELTKEINEAFYDETQGTIGPCVSLYIFVQMEAIWSRKETFDAQTVRSVARRHLKPWQVAIQLYRTGLDKHIHPPILDTDKPNFNTFLQNRDGVINQVPSNQQTNPEGKRPKVKDVIFSILENKCLPEYHDEIVEIVLKKYPKAEEIQKAINEALVLAEQKEDNQEKSLSGNNENISNEVDPQTSKDDLREIISRKNNKEKDAYSILKASGIIKKPDSFSSGPD